MTMILKKQKFFEITYLRDAQDSQIHRLMHFCLLDSCVACVSRFTINGVRIPAVLVKECLGMTCRAAHRLTAPIHEAGWNNQPKLWMYEHVKHDPHPSSNIIRACYHFRRKEHVTPHESLLPSDMACGNS